MLALLLAACGPSPAAEAGLRPANGVDLYVRELGRGAPLVVLHGGPGDSHTYFLPQLEALAADHRLILYDQRASGRSGGQDDPAAFTAATFVADLEGLRQTLDLEQMTLLGHSWGGLLALQYALAHPQRVRALILVSPGPPSADGLDALRLNLARRMSAADSRAVDAAYRRALREGTPAAVADFKARLYHFYFFDPDRSAELSPIEASPASARVAFRVNQAIWASLGDYDLRPALATLDVPALIVHCPADPVPLEGARQIHENLPGSQWVELEGCGHFPFVEAPEAFFDSVRGFLQGLP